MGYIISYTCVLAQSCPTLCHPMDCSLPGSSTHGILQARLLKWVAISYSRGSSQYRDRTQVSCDSCIDRWILYQLCHMGSSKNTGEGSLSLLQRIFQTQESMRGLLHCGWILYQLSYQGTWVWAYWEIMKDREAWHAVVHDIAKSQTQLSDWTTATAI